MYILVQQQPEQQASYAKFHFAIFAKYFERLMFFASQFVFAARIQGSQRYDFFLFFETIFNLYRTFHEL